MSSIKRNRSLTFQKSDRNCLKRIALFWTFEFMLWETTPMGHTRTPFVHNEFHRFYKPCWRKTNRRKLKKCGRLAAFLLINDFMKSPDICHLGNCGSYIFSFTEPYLQKILPPHFLYLTPWTTTSYVGGFKRLQKFT